MEELRIPCGDSYMYGVSFGEGKRPLLILAGIGLQTLEGRLGGVDAAYAPLCRDFRVFLLDRRVTVPAGFTVKDFAEDVYHAAQAVGAKKASLLGVSHGGMMSLQLALDHPEFVESMVLASTCSRLTPFSRDLFCRWLAWSREGNVRAINRSFQEYVYSEAFRKANRAAFEAGESVGTADDCRRFATLCESILNFDVYDRLCEIKTPAMAIGAEGDRIFGAETVVGDFVQGLGCESYLYPGYGHAVYDEAPDYKERLLRFFAKY